MVQSLCVFRTERGHATCAGNHGIDVPPLGVDVDPIAVGRSGIAAAKVGILRIVRPSGSEESVGFQSADDVCFGGIKVGFGERTLLHGGAEDIRQRLHDKAVAVTGIDS